MLLKIAKVRTPVYTAIIYAAAHTGMRKSELIGLTWEHVDLKAEKFYIRQTITDANGKYIFSIKSQKRKTKRGKINKGTEKANSGAQS